ncbi:MAG TPA: hypothetical protein VNO21_11615 [Polyangiaceae bacterium]|nr:hypothetical protein [Polyangiaceae bacterium]
MRVLEGARGEIARARIRGCAAMFVLLSLTMGAGCGSDDSVPAPGDAGGADSGASDGGFGPGDGGTTDTGDSGTTELFVCGNGRIEDAENCDDGNRIPDDGCSAQCNIEPGWMCTGEPSRCSHIR